MKDNSVYFSLFSKLSILKDKLEKFKESHPEIDKDIENDIFNSPNAPIYENIIEKHIIKNGRKTRIIYEPKGEFKSLLKEIHKTFKLLVYFSHTPSVSNNIYFMGLNKSTSIPNVVKSALHNVNPFLTSVLKADLHDFFGSIKYEIFMSLIGWQKKVIETLENMIDITGEEKDAIKSYVELIRYMLKIVFYKGSLPQGFPTSPLFSYYFLSYFMTRMAPYVNMINASKFSASLLYKDELFKLASKLLNLFKNSKNVARDVTLYSLLSYANVAERRSNQGGIKPYDLCINGKELSNVNNEIVELASQHFNSIPSLLLTKSEISYIDRNINDIASSTGLNNFTVFVSIYDTLANIIDSLDDNVKTLHYVDDMIIILPPITKEVFIEHLVMSFKTIGSKLNDHVDVDALRKLLQQDRLLFNRVKKIFLSLLTSMFNNVLFGKIVSLNFNFSKMVTHVKINRKRENENFDGILLLTKNDVQRVFGKWKELKKTSVKLHINGNEVIPEINLPIRYSARKTKLMFRNSLKYFLGVYWYDINKFSTTRYKHARDKIYHYYHDYIDGKLDKDKRERLIDEWKELEGVISFARAVIDTDRNSMKETLEMLETLKKEVIYGNNKNRKSESKS